MSEFNRHLVDEMNIKNEMQSRCEQLEIQISSVTRQLNAISKENELTGEQKITEFELREGNERATIV